MVHHAPHHYLCSACKLGFYTFPALMDHVAAAHPKIAVHVYCLAPGLSGKDALRGHLEAPHAKPA